ncbi:ATP phosphoribosyltransferase [Candidatus Microgenomates bacterium]|nr:MAG: ATP phosphoribosyltransferase [Candidatus Microgenomates bacterium]
MKKIIKLKLKLAIQKQGRLTDETLAFLRASGLNFESYKQKLYTTCRNFPVEIYYVRDSDIAQYVASGVVDLGIVGQNTLYEKRPKVKKVLNLRFGFCTLVIAVPKESPVSSLVDLKNKTIATSYPASTSKYFAQRNVPINVVTINGSVEITPSLGVSEAVADLTSTGSTLVLNELRILEKIYDSEAILIANQESLTNGKEAALDQLITRFKSVLSAKDYKLVQMYLPESALSKVKKISFGLKCPIISPTTKTGILALQYVVKEEVLWENLERLQKFSVSNIAIMPIEKILI